MTGDSTSQCSGSDAACAAGYWCPGDGSRHACPAGKWGNEAAGQTSESAACPNDCTAGSYCPDTGATSEGGNCAAGHYCPDVTTQTECEAGKYNDEERQTAASDCKDCVFDGCPSHSRCSLFIECHACYTDSVNNPETDRSVHCINQELTGTIPAALGKLTDLTTLLSLIHI